jgi:hypothetical protein
LDLFKKSSMQKSVQEEEDKHLQSAVHLRAVRFPSLQQQSSQGTGAQRRFAKNAAAFDKLLSVVTPHIPMCPQMPGSEVPGRKLVGPELCAFVSYNIWKDALEHPGSVAALRHCEARKKTYEPALAQSEGWLLRSAMKMIDVLRPSAANAVGGAQSDVPAGTFVTEDE